MKNESVAKTERGGKERKMSNVVWWLIFFHFDRNMIVLRNLLNMSKMFWEMNWRFRNYPEELHIELITIFLLFPYFKSNIIFFVLWYQIECSIVVKELKRSLIIKTSSPHICTHEWNLSQHMCQVFH